MSYNPADLISYLKAKLADVNQEFKGLPYCEGFQGTIEKLTETKFLIKGKYETLATDKIRITELPVGTWTEDFKEFLEGLLEDKNGKKTSSSSLIKDYDDMSKDTTVDFIITLQKGKLDELESMSGDTPSTNGVHKAFKLITTQSTNNMHLFDAKDKLKKYASVSEINLV